jgi:hypothetical protein
MPLTRNFICEVTGANCTNKDCTVGNCIIERTTTWSHLTADERAALRQVLTKERQLLAKDRRTYDEVEIVFQRLKDLDKKRQP